MSSLIKASKLHLFLLRRKISAYACHVKLGIQHPASQEIYEKTNGLVEKYSEIGFFAIKNVIVPCFIIPKAVVSFLIYFTTDSFCHTQYGEFSVRSQKPISNKNYEQEVFLELKSIDCINIGFDLFFRLPFDWKNPLGYLVAVAATSIMASDPLHYMGCFLFLFYGVYMFSISIVKDLKGQLHSINKLARGKKCRADMYKKLSKFIRLHADIKQLSG